MPQSKNMPCLVCPTCAHYEYNPHTSNAHRCKDSSSFTNSSKCGQNPDKDGTSTNNCRCYKPR